MNYLAKPWWHQVRNVTAVCGLLLLGSCASDSTEQEQEEEQVPGATTNELDTGPAQVTPDSTLQPVQEITIRTVGDEENQKHFDSDTIEVKANTLVKLDLVNEGSEQSMIHNIVFTRAGKTTQVALAGEKVGAPGNYVPDDTVRVLASSSLALPGQTVTLEFEAPDEPGTYHFVCTYPEHYKQMRGVLIVK